MPEADLPGLPRGPLHAWLVEHLPSDLDDDWTAEIVAGGLSNITYRLRLPDGDVILRRPPLGGVLQSAHDMGREYRVQAALAGTHIPVAPMLAFETDPDVLGAPFYVMAAVPGDVLRTAADTGRLTVAQRAILAETVVDTLVQLHQVDYNKVGLGDFGRPDGYSKRQLQRWQKQWEASRTRELPDMETLIEQLGERLPRQADATIVHGDYRLDNTLVDAGVVGDEVRIAAVLDWELSTLGDPLADVALMATYWEEMSDPTTALLAGSAGATAHEGFPTARDLTQTYAERSGRDVSDLPFHLALASMKLAVIIEGVHARYVGGHTVSAGYEGLAGAVPQLVARGLRLL